MSTKYIFNFEETKALPTNGRNTSYGTIIYQPLDENGQPSYRIDFGPHVWPRRKIKENCCRILLVSTWTDFKWGFPGGGIEDGETPLETMNREFLEEIGIDIEFKQNDFCFAYYISNKEQQRLSYTFCKVIHELESFQTILQAFEIQHHREAYVNESIAISGLPIYFEGGNEDIEVSWENNTIGITRYLVQNGGSFTTTLDGKQIVREQFILLLLLLNIVSISTMKRIIKLANQFQGIPINFEQLQQDSGIDKII